MTTQLEAYRAHERDVIKRLAIKYAECVVCNVKAIDLDPDFPNCKGLSWPIFDVATDPYDFFGRTIIACQSCQDKLIDPQTPFTKTECRDFRRTSDRIRALARR